MMNETKQIWGRKGSTLVRKYRCSSGARKGRIVSSPTACFGAPNPKKSAQMKRTRARLSKQMARRARRTRKINPASKVLRKVNR